MSISLGTQFEQDLITLAGWTPNTIDGGSTTVDLVNSTSGQTTVRATVVASVDTITLQALVQKYTTTETT